MTLIRISTPTAASIAIGGKVHDLIALIDPSRLPDMRHMGPQGWRNDRVAVICDVAYVPVRGVMVRGVVTAVDHTNGKVTVEYTTTYALNRADRDGVNIRISKVVRPSYEVWVRWEPFDRKQSNRLYTLSEALMADLRA